MKLIAWHDVPEGEAFPEAILSFGQCSPGHEIYDAIYLGIKLPIPVYWRNYPSFPIYAWHTGWFFPCFDVVLDRGTRKLWPRFSLEPIRGWITTETRMQRAERLWRAEHHE